MRILVVDDDAVSRLIAQATVEGQGHECRTAEDGDEAWQEYVEWRPDVVVSDRAMPGLDGLELCRRIRADEEGYTYIVLVTGLSNPADVLDGMHAGADDYVGKPLDPFALQTRLLAAERVTRLHAQLAEAKAELTVQAHTDPLTGLRNRLGLAEDLDQLHAVSQRYDRSYCAALGDVDFFKRYNDRYGHPAGDDVLRTVAAVLQEQVRAGDRVYRFGGEEFLVLLPEQTTSGALVAMNRLLSALRAQALPHADGVADGIVTMSVGVAACTPGSRLTSEALLAAADAALYEAKAAGRDRVVVAGTLP